MPKPPVAPIGADPRYDDRFDPPDPPSWEMSPGLGFAALVVGAFGASAGLVYALTTRPSASAIVVAAIVATGMLLCWAGAIAIIAVWRYGNIVWFKLSRYLPLRSVLHESRRERDHLHDVIHVLMGGDDRPVFTFKFAIRRDGELMVTLNENPSQSLVPSTFLTVEDRQDGMMMAHLEVTTKKDGTGDPLCRLLHANGVLLGLLEEAATKTNSIDTRAVALYVGPKRPVEEGEPL